MSEPRHGVGLNGEPDDFSARYDRMVIGGGAAGWLLGSLAALLVLLALAAVVSSVLGG